MKDDPIEQLADFFTGSEVGIHSIGLNIPSMRERAQRFFAVRSSLGIDGYDTKEKAMKSILRALFKLEERHAETK